MLNAMREMSAMFQPPRIGRLSLRHRVNLAPPTRSRLIRWIPSPTTGNIVQDYRWAAERAAGAGFDGVKCMRPMAIRVAHQSHSDRLSITLNLSHLV